MLLHDASHMLEHNFSSIFEELARFNVLKIYHSTGQYAAFKRGIDFTPNESLRITVVCTRIITPKMYKTFNTNLP